MNQLTTQEIADLLVIKNPYERKSKVQEIGYRHWKANNERGTEECATGVGKTRIALLAIHEKLKADKNALIYIVVPTETLRDTDWPNEMDEAGYSYMKNHPNIVRICYASLHMQRPERDVDLIILDEVHHLTPANVVFFNGDWKVFSIMGLTATLPKEDEYSGDADKRILINRLCPSIFVVPLETAVELELVSEFEIYLMYFDLDNIEHYIDNGKNRAKTTEQQEYKKLTKQLAKSMWSGNENFKFQCIQKRVAFLNTLRSKKILAKEIMDQIIPGNRTLIFFGSIEQSKELCGEQVYNSLSNDEQLSLFQDEKISYLGVVDAVNEGKNIKNLNNALLLKFTSKDRVFKQRIGRVVRFRPGHVGKIIVLVAKGTVEEKWIESALVDFDKSRIKKFNVIPKSERIKTTS